MPLPHPEEQYNRWLACGSGICLQRLFFELTSGRGHGASRTPFAPEDVKTKHRKWEDEDGGIQCIVCLPMPVKLLDVTEIYVLAGGEGCDKTESIAMENLTIGWDHRFSCILIQQRRRP